MKRRHYIFGLYLGLFILLIVAPLGSVIATALFYGPELANASDTNSFYSLAVLGIRTSKVFAVSCGIIGLTIFLSSYIQLKHIKRIEQGGPGYPPQSVGSPDP